jgi:hypothetical protein
MAADDPFEWVKDLRRTVPTSLVRQIVEDFRSYSPTPRADPSAKVQIQGAPTVKTGDVGPQHRPIDANATNSRGWQEPPKVDNWSPPGLREMDELMDAADARDRLERIREAAETAALKKAEAEFLKTKTEPKPKGERK